MVYVLEGTSIAMASHGAGAVQTSLGLPADAFRYLTSHGVLDRDHMVFFERLMNRIDDRDDQDAIIRMAKDMFRLFGGCSPASIWRHRVSQLEGRTVMLTGAAGGTGSLVAAGCGTPVRPSSE